MRNLEVKEFRRGNFEFRGHHPKFPAGGDLTVRVNKRYEDEVGRLADTLNHMAGELGRLERLKNEFISAISHELRTPLTSIKGWVVTLQQRNLSREEKEQGLQIIHRRKSSPC